MHFSRNCATYLQLYSSPGRLNKQKTTCSSTIAPPAASASRRRELSYASANTPPINVSRNGSAHSHGDEGIPVVTSTTISRKHSSGAVSPKYRDRRTPR